MAAGVDERPHDLELLAVRKGIRMIQYGIQLLPCVLGSRRAQDDTLPDAPALLFFAPSAHFVFQTVILRVDGCREA